ncbi:hypothetical protein Goarm_019808 [Gossypium armourianum]|uniref:Uncharacterized protein n=1 Tax=Gossypium armourianum TaxID=34283 RepID=A0A7J9ILQ0_9ROSI|nr:hypothetical protein [Gossypium armourianum]
MLGFHGDVVLQANRFLSCGCFTVA